jgi:hypothetical protein
MTPESRKWAANDAKALLDSKIFRAAFAGVAEYIDAQALGCDPDNAAKAQRIIIAKQILAGIKREIERVVEDGVVAEIQIAEVEQRKKLFKFIR